MPQLGRFVRVSYSTDGQAAAAMRLLNQHIQKNGLENGEAHRRVLTFVTQGKEQSDARREHHHADPRPRGEMSLPIVFQEAGDAQ